MILDVLRRNNFSTRRMTKLGRPRVGKVTSNGPAVGVKGIASISVLLIAGWITSCEQHPETAIPERVQHSASEMELRKTRFPEASSSPVFFRNTYYF